MSSVSPKERYFKLPQEREKEFLIYFLWELTISGRSIWSEEDYSQSTVIEGMKQINEINHRVLNRLRDLEDGEKWSSRESTWEDIKHHTNLAPETKGWVVTSLNRSFEHLGV